METYWNWHLLCCIQHLFESSGQQSSIHIPISDFLWLGVCFLCSRFYWIICVIPKLIVCFSFKLLNSSDSFSWHFANAGIFKSIPLCAMIILWIPSLIHIVCYTSIEYMQVKLYGSKMVRLICELWNIEIMLKYLVKLLCKWDARTWCLPPCYN